MGYCGRTGSTPARRICVRGAATGREATIPHVIARSAGTEARDRDRRRGTGRARGGAGSPGERRARRGRVRGRRRARRPGAGRRGPEATARDSGHRRLAARQCARLGVVIRCNVYAEAADVLAGNPDVVVVATGGVPNMSFLDAGADCATSTWDILTGAVKPAGRVLLYDDNGAHPRHDGGRVHRGRRIETRSGDARTHARSRRGERIIPPISARCRLRERPSKSIFGSNGSSGTATPSPGSSSTDTASAAS